MVQAAGPPTHPISWRSRNALGPDGPPQWSEVPPTVERPQRSQLVNVGAAGSRNRVAQLCCTRCASCVPLVRLLLVVIPANLD